MKKLFITIAMTMVYIMATATTWTLQGSSYTVDITATSSLGAGTTLTKAHVYNSSRSLRVFYTVTDLTNDDVAIKAVPGGSKLTSRSTVQSMAQNITGATAIAGVNGGFFSTSCPGGFTVINGKTRKGFSGDGYYSVAIEGDKVPYIGYLNQLTCWCSAVNGIEGWSNYAAINSTPAYVSDCGVGEMLIFYTPEYGSSTETSGTGGYAVQLTPVNEATLLPGEYIKYKVTSSPSSSNVTIPSDGIVLYGRGTQNGAYVSSLSVGQEITIYLKSYLKDNDSAIESPIVRQALGGSAMILCNGVTLSSYPNSLGDISYAAPRTAVGYNADKTKLVMCVVDGRNSGYSDGCNGKILGDIMKALGCSDALNFDGGGSSQFWTCTEGIVNDPNNNNSGNGIRAVADGFFIVKLPTPVLTTSSNAISFSTTNNTAVTQAVTISGSDLRENINLSLSGSNANQFSISATSIAQNAASGTITISYVPTSVGTHTATLTISSKAAATKTISISGSNTEDDSDNLNDYVQVMTEGWNYSANTTQPAWLNITTSGSTRFIAENEGKLYVLNCSPWGTPVINILDAYTGEDTGSDVNLDGVSGGLTAISSIRFVDGVLVGANACNANHTFTVYAWKDGVSAAPTKILEDAAHGGLVMGSNISISGNLTNGYIWATDDGVKNVLKYSISGGTVSTTPAVINLKKDGAAISLVGSRGAGEVVANEDGTFWVVGQSAYPSLFAADGTYKSEMNAGALNNNNHGTALKFFDYGTKKYAAAVAYTEGQTNGYFTLCNVTNGIDLTTGYNCKHPAAGLGATANDQNMSSIAQSLSEDGYKLNIWVCCVRQGVAYYYYDGRISTDIENVMDDFDAVELNVYSNGNTLIIDGVEAKAVAVYSMSGAMVRMANNVNEIAADGLNGIYVVVVVDSNGATYTKKVAIR